jgi:cytochrome c oxidase assembly protein Cox11
LVDTNADNIPDTGPVSAAGYYTVVLKVTLPSTISPIPTGPFDAKITATSAGNSALSNVVIDRLMTISNLKLQLTPDNSGQISPGGTVVYAHTLINTGNTQCTDSFTFNVTPNPAAAGWSYTLYEDANNNSVIDATDPEITKGSAYDINGGILGDTPFAVNGNFKVLLKVFAPANATPPTVDIAKIVANGSCGGKATASSPVVDTTTVIIGQVRLVKTQALDKTCDGKNGTASAIPASAYAATQISAKPGECISYKIEATNEGLGQVTGLLIKDTTPAYTGYNGDPVCSKNGSATGTTAAVSPAGAKPTATANGTQNVLESCNIGDLPSGVKATMDMSVQVNKF